MFSDNDLVLELKWHKSQFSWEIQNRSSVRVKFKITGTEDARKKKPLEVFKFQLKKIYLSSPVILVKAQSRYLNDSFLLHLKVLMKPNRWSIKSERLSLANAILSNVKRKTVFFFNLNRIFN